MSNTQKRIITGFFYILVLVFFFGMKLLFAYRYGRVYGSLWFDALILFFTVVGTHEMLNALGDRLQRVQKIVVMLFSVLLLVTYVVLDTVFVEVVGVAPPTPGEYNGHCRAV